MDDVEVTAAGPQHLEGMARCHIACFPDQFTSRMGPAYAAAFYEAHIRGDGGIALVAADGNGEVLGVAIGGRPGIREEFVASAKRRFLGALIARTLTDRVVLSALLARAGRRLGIGRRAADPGISAVVGDEHCWALLQVIAVVPRARGSGLADRLMDAFRSACLAAGYESMYLPVFTSNSRAITFYRKHGWQVVKEVAGSTYMRCPTAQPA